MAQLPLISVNLATVALESMLYGVFLVLALTFLYLHFSRVGSQRSGGTPVLSAYFTPVLFGSMFVMLTVTGHWVMTVYRLFDAFVNFMGGKVPLLYYSDLALTTEAVKIGFLIATIITCDILFIYRLWTVWGYNYYVIILPCFTVLGLCVAGPGVVYELTQVGSGNTVFIASLSRWISADYAFTFVTNVYSSVGIGWRVWRARQRTGSYGGGNLMRVLVTIVESAALYTSYTIFFFGSYQAQSNLQYTAVDTLCPIAGIAFMMINVRVGLGWAQRAHPSTSSGITSRRTAMQEQQSFAMRPVAVDISKVVDTDDGLPMGVKSELPV
ncbi:uncharacterized protein B0H18DRAFT_930395 [Fomitopsis serialis]|uniref:uncharacterized protein n=1 Tax=Fomitopsis serialis TaxID=139415 RepID=UPI002008D4A4|nr:uncharacterized protein B0H18DRAFT_930395 [Neoantrodia serialis]KAH9930740.1 hypothetical protein B0H18DRAFT_930395 [Neoantrodia serialis]